MIYKILSEDEKDGACCIICGCYFIDGLGIYVKHGFPVACLYCWFNECVYPKSKYNIFK